MSLTTAFVYLVEPTDRVGPFRWYLEEFEFITFNAP